MNEPTSGPSDKQIAFLRRMLERCYTGDRAHLIEPFIATLTTGAEASAAIQTMIDAGFGDPRPAAQPVQRAKATKASPGQVEFAESLIRQYWHDSDIGQGFHAPTRRDLERMDGRDVSALIRDLQRDAGV